MKSRRALLATAVAVAVHTAAAIQADLFLLDTQAYPDAVCMDGSPGAPQRAGVRRVKRPRNAGSLCGPQAATTFKLR